MTMIAIAVILIIIAANYGSCADDLGGWHRMSEDEIRQADENRAQFEREFAAREQRFVDERQLYADEKKLRKDLERHPPPVRIAEPPYFKAKGLTFGSNYLESEEIARNIGEVKTIIRIDCKKAALLGQYNFYRKYPGSDQRVPTGGKVPVFANRCQVTVIDYTIPAVIARKSFENSEAPIEKDFSSEFVGSEYLCPEPRVEIAAFVKSLVRK